MIAAHRIRRKLGGFGPDQENKEALEESFEETTTVDIDAIYEKAEGEASSVLENRNFEEAIKIFDQKGLLYDVAPIFDEEGEAYKDYVVRLLASGHDELMEASKAHVSSLRRGQEEET